MDGSLKKLQQEIYEAMSKEHPAAFHKVHLSEIAAQAALDWFMKEIYENFDDMPIPQNG